MPKDETLTASSPEEMLKVLQGDDYETARSLLELGRSLGCTVEAKTGAQSYKIVFSVPAPNRRALFTIECSAKKWRVKANLFRIAGYQAAVQESSDAIRRSIRKTRACVQCNPGCRGRSTYVLDGETLMPCYGGGHYFKGLAADDWSRLEELISLECGA